MIHISKEFVNLTADYFSSLLRNVSFYCPFPLSFYRIFFQSIDSKVQYSTTQLFSVQTVHTYKQFHRSATPN